MSPAAPALPADSPPGDLPPDLLPLVRALARMAARRQRAAALTLEPPK